MRIAFIANAAATHAQRWAAAMAYRGHEVRLYSVRHAAIAGVDVISTVDTDNARPSPFEIARGYARLRTRIPKEAARFDPDVVHVHYASTNGYIASLAHLRPVVLTVWGTDVVPRPERRLSVSARYRAGRAIRHADIVTSTSDFMADHVRKLSEPKRLEIVPFGVDTDRFAPAPPPADPIVLVAKSLEARYGVDHVIRAMPRVIDVVAGARLVIAGDGRLRSSLEALAARHNVPTVFLGKVPHRELPDQIAAAAVVVNPTIVDESFGVVVLEAQAVGRPVVTTRVGAIPTVCIEGDTATLVPPGDERAMASALIDVLQHRTLTRALIQGPPFVSENYSWSASVEAMESLYFDAMR